MRQRILALRSRRQKLCNVHIPVETKGIPTHSTAEIQELFLVRPIRLRRCTGLTVAYELIQFTAIPNAPPHSPVQVWA